MMSNNLEPSVDLEDGYDPQEDLVELHQQAELFNVVLDAAPDAFIIADESGNITIINRQAELLLGYVRDELIGKSIETIIPARYRDGHHQKFQDFFTGGGSRPMGRGLSLFAVHKQGHEVPVDISISLVETSSGKMAISAIRDASKTRKDQERLQHISLHDRLTGLSNRVHFEDRLNDCIKRMKANAGFYFGVLFIDLDRFKSVNDSLGHGVGDELLQSVASRLQQVLRSSDVLMESSANHTPARVGGDEFTVLLEDIEEKNVIVIAHRLVKEISRPYFIDDNEVIIGASIGIAMSDQTIGTAADVVRDADIAMYRAKTDGRGCCKLFDHRMRDEIQTRSALEYDLRKALIRNEFVLHYQPVVSLETGQLHGFEALLRWNHPTQGLMMPDRFIALAEETDTIVGMGAWVLSEATRQLSEWQKRYTQYSGMTMAVNLSRRQLSDPNLVEYVRRVIHENNINPKTLVLELTENMIMENVDSARETLAQLQGLGAQLHMDDFGTGYSSLSLLHSFPLDGLKIDRSFVMNLSSCRQYSAVVHAVVSLAQNMNMLVVAEGIEEESHLTQLQAMDCDTGQGYFFSKPMPVSAAEQYIKQCSEQGQCYSLAMDEKPENNAA